LGWLYRLAFVSGFNALTFSGINIPARHQNSCAITMPKTLMCWVGRRGEVQVCLASTSQGLAQVPGLSQREHHTCNRRHARVQTRRFSLLSPPPPSPPPTPFTTDTNALTFTSCRRYVDFAPGERPDEMSLLAGRAPKAVMCICAWMDTCSGLTSICLSVCLFACLSLLVGKDPKAVLCLCLPVYLSTVCLHICLPVCLLAVGTGSKSGQR
jgi:hypothetical protein